MKIHLAKSAGFCFGIRRALDLAFKTAAKHARVYMLGDLVHNEDVIAAIKKAGIRKIRTLGPGRGKTLLVRAHGASRATLERARKLGYTIIDATCPMVKEIHTIAAAAEKDGYTVIIIGDKRHDEVRGIVGQIKKRAIVIDDADAIPMAAVKKLKRGAVVVQSTQNQEKVEKIVSVLKKQIPDFRFFNTICGPTRVKQAEIKCLPLQNDVVIVIGSKHSANTRRLFEISRSLNPRSHWVRSKDDIRPEWFRGARSVGITAGASTPRETTQGIIELLKAYRSPV